MISIIWVSFFLFCYEMKVTFLFAVKMLAISPVTTHKRTKFIFIVNEAAVKKSKAN